MVADILDPFDLLFALVLPIVDVINGALILQTLQKSLILVENVLESLPKILI